VSVRDGTDIHDAKPLDKHFAELLIDCEEDRTLRVVLVGMLREGDRSGPS
jgi:hypothetical protein